MIDDWREFAAETREAAIEAAKGHFSVSGERLELRWVPADLDVSGLGSRVLLLASLKDEPPADLSDVGEFLFGVLQRMNLASRLRIDESDDDGDLVFRISGPALEAAVRRDPGIVGALAHLGERVAQEILGEELALRIDVPRSARSDRSEGRDGRDGRRGPRSGRSGGRDDRRSRSEGRGRGGDRPRRGGRRTHEDGDERLEKYTRQVAEELLADGGERVLDPMSSRERWVVHNTVKSIDGVTSESVGDDDEKRVKLIAE